MKISELILPSNKKFGIFFCVIFLIFSIYFYLNFFLTLSVFFIIFSLIFIILAFSYPKLLLPLNYAWMFLGFSLGRIINPIVLGIIYFLLITPIGIIRRFLGNDELKLHNNKKLSSYWIPKKNNTEVSNFKNQF